MSRRFWGLLAGGLLFAIVLAPTIYALRDAQRSWQGDQEMVIVPQWNDDLETIIVPPWNGDPEMVIVSPWNGDPEMGRFIPFPSASGEFIRPD